MKRSFVISVAILAVGMGLVAFLQASGIVPPIVPALVPAANKTGTGSLFAIGTGTYTNGHGIVIDVNGNLVDSGAAPSGGTGNAAALVTLTFSATPTFTCPSATAGTVVDFQAAANVPITLTGNITSSTLATCTPGALLNFLFKQDATGGRTVAMPSGFDAAPVHLAANVTTKLTYYYDGANGRLVNSTADAGYSQCTENAQPGANPASGTEYIFCSSATHRFTELDSSGNLYALPLVDFYHLYQLPAGINSAGTAAGGWSTPSTNACSATAKSGTNVQTFTWTCTSTQSVQAWIYLSQNWDTAVNPYVRFDVMTTDTTNGHTIIPTVKGSCVKGDLSTSFDQTFQTAQSGSSVTVGVAGVANGESTGSTVQLNSTSMTNCIAGSKLYLSLSVSGSATATDQEIAGLYITVPEKNVAGAQ